MPAAVSLISTHLPRSRLHLGVAIVTSGASFGMGLTFLIQAATGPDVPVPTDGISHGRLQVPDWDWGPSGPPGGLANNSVEFQYHPLEGWYEDNFRAGFVALGLLGCAPLRHFPSLLDCLHEHHHAPNDAPTSAGVVDARPTRKR